METKLIDTLEALEKENVTFETLDWMHGTGRSSKKGYGIHKKDVYRFGVATKIGDVERSVWYEAARRLIERRGEMELYNWLCEWLKDNGYYSCQDKAEREQYALQLHVCRIFDDKDWVDYERFNLKYRPEKIIIGGNK